MQTSKLVIILSQIDDAHIPFVTAHLKLPVVIIDAQNIVQGEELTYHTIKSKLSITYNEQCIDGVTGIWLRRPRYVQSEVSFPVHSRNLNYARSALDNHMKCLYTAFRQKTWVSNYYAILQANNKTLQATIATQIGFRTPEAIYTSDSARAQKFVNSHKTVVVKTHAREFARNKSGSPLTFLTYKINKGQHFNYQGLQLAPAIFQEAIDPALEVRVTVVKKTVFAASVHYQPNNTSDITNIRDWRLGSYKGSLSFAPFTLPTEIHEKCVNLIASLNLNYGAIDLIIDKKGTYWFLENNANGQWAFIEEATGQPIGHAIAQLLSN